MDKKGGFLGNEFQKYLANEFSNYMDPANELITFPYSSSQADQDEKKAMAVTLIFWRFLKKHAPNSLGLSLTEKRSCIAGFIRWDERANEYPLIKTVAMIEALPTVIWRKLLWRENIDFSSYEACLRRLNAEQVQAIEDNYNDLFGLDHSPVTPRVLKKSWRDRVKLFFGITSVKKILLEETDTVPDQHYYSKGAYAFSLLGLDFGFSLYPKGDNDDTKITNKKFTRFLSVKEHINDFAVNKEDGKYWWLYRTARSNYAFNPGAEVKMKDHVCPGFWATLIRHAMFWIVSPIAVATTIPLIMYNGFKSELLLPLIFALPMIVWILVVLIRLIDYAFFMFTALGKVAKYVGITIGILLLTTVALIIIYGVGKILWFCTTNLAGLCGPLLAVMFMLTATFYVVFFFTSVIPEGRTYKYRDVPLFARYLLHLSLGAFIVVLFDKFIAYALINLITTAAKSFWHWYSDDLLLSNWLILTIIFTGLFIRFYKMFFKDEKEFASFERTFTWLTTGFFTLTIIVFGIILVKAGGLVFTELGLIPSLSLSIVFILFAAALFMLDQVNRKTISDRELVSKFILRLDDEMEGVAYKNYISSILKSRWLNAMEINERWLIVGRIEKLAFTFFDESASYRTNFVQSLISNGSISTVNNLRTNRWRIIDDDYNRKERYTIVELIIKGTTIEEAIDAVSLKRNMVRKTSLKMKKVGGVIIAPFKLAFKFVRLIGLAIKRFFLTLKDIWSLFNERCPFITESKYLD